MNERTEYVRFGAVLAAALLLMGMPGCIYFGEKSLHDEPLNRAAIDGIRKGTTTGREVIRRLGPPHAVLHCGGASLAGKHPGAVHQPDAVFELFTPERTAPKEMVIYYYNTVHFSGSSMFLLPLGFGAKRSDLSRRDRLWLLVNAATDVVEDHVYRSRHADQ